MTWKSAALMAGLLVLLLLSVADVIEGRWIVIGVAATAVMLVLIWHKRSGH
jgi:K+ transporter